MAFSGIIRADGTIQYDGFTPMKARVVDINERFIAIHFAGDVYWDNGGKHYVAARIEVLPIQRLKPGEKEGTWRFKLGGGRTAAVFHAKPGEACHQATGKLRTNGVSLSNEIGKVRDA